MFCRVYVNVSLRLSVFQVEAARIHQNDERSLPLTASFLPRPPVKQSNERTNEWTSIRPTDQLLRVPVPDCVCEDFSCKLGSGAGFVVHIFLQAFPVAKEDVFMYEHTQKQKDRRAILQTYHDVVEVWRAAVWFQWQSCPHCGTSVAVPHGTPYGKIELGNSQWVGTRGAVNQTTQTGFGCRIWQNPSNLCNNVVLVPLKPADLDHSGTALGSFGELFCGSPTEVISLRLFVCF